VDYCIEREVVSVEDITYSHVRQYLIECQERGKKAGTINTKLLRIRAFLNYMVECEVIKSNPSAHTFRHTFCHRLAMSDMSAFAIQKLMRHQNIAVTMRYVAMWGNELREQNDKYNPLNSLDI
jgi:site-specific recombinase XerD